MNTNSTVQCEPALLRNDIKNYKIISRCRGMSRRRPRVTRRNQHSVSCITSLQAVVCIYEGHKPISSVDPSMEIMGVEEDFTAPASGRWTPEEDEKLRSAVLEHGAQNWKKISLLMDNGGRTDTQVRQMLLHVRVSTKFNIFECRSVYIDGRKFYDLVSRRVIAIFMYISLDSCVNGGFMQARGRKRRIPCW